MFAHKLGEKTELRLLEVRHARELTDLTDRNREHLRAWMPWLDANRTVGDRRNFIRGALEQFAENNGFQAGIWHGGRLAGVVGHHGIDRQDHSTSLGYWLGEEFEGRGLMTAACRALVGHAFGELGLNRVVIACATGNRKSCAIPERLGFRREGHPPPGRVALRPLRGPRGLRHPRKRVADAPRGPAPSGTTTTQAREGRRLNQTPEKRVAIVTAAGKGLGAACARELAARGYSLALMSPSGSASDLAEELGGAGFQGSVTEEADLRALVDGTLDAYGRVDAVVNGTGHPPSGDEILDIADADWHAGLDMVVLNVVRMARLVTPVMARQGGGAIVNVSTFSAFEPSAAFPVSSVLRSALAGFTKLYADRHAAGGVRMNNVLPGYMDNFEVDEGTRASIPMRRPGAVEEVARAAAFLVSPDASYITGQNLRVDGGLTRSV